MIARSSAVVVALLLAAACGSKSSTSTTTTPEPIPTPAPTPAPDPAIAPRPFTAEQIRAAMPVGTEIKMRMEAKDEPTMIAGWLVTEADDRSVSMSTRIYAEDGTTLVHDEGTEETTWTSLMEHATFPADATTITDSSVEVPAGNFTTRLYEVKSPDGSITRLHFVMTMPGPPVSFTIERDGVIVQRMSLIERR